LLDQADSIIDMHFMLQREVVDRLTAEPGGRDWGRLGVMTAARARAERLFGVPPGAFRPAPKVESALVRIVPRRLTDSQAARLPRLERVVRQAFAQRRKTLRNTLKGLIDAETLAACGVDPARRAETLSLAEFGRLADALPADEVPA
jgi:16S rRNA (adenine1518-N6/adenine1519-N6)-dimethyltransferase